MSQAARSFLHLRRPPIASFSASLRIAMYADCLAAGGKRSVRDRLRAGVDDERYRPRSNVGERYTLFVSLFSILKFGFSIFFLKKLYRVA